MGYLKRAVIALVMVCVVVGTSGCGGLASKSNTTLSGNFSTEYDSIWYEVFADEDDGFGKDSKIYTAFVFKDGALSIYESIYDITLGDLNQLKEDEIIELLKKNKESQYADQKEELAKAKEGCDFALSGVFFEKQLGSSGTLYNLSADKSFFEGVSKSLEAYDFIEETPEFKIALYTDSTGNITDKEVISYRRSTFMGADNMLFTSLSGLKDDAKSVSETKIYSSLANVLNVSSEEIKVNGVFKGIIYTTSGLKKELLQCDFSNISSVAYPMDTRNIEITNPSNGAVKVYDSSYSGYICEDNLLVTKVDDKSFTFDEVGDSDVIVDPADEDLFKE